MVRVWFGDESQGLKRDRNEFVLTIHRNCADGSASEKFYCDALGFHVVGLTRNPAGRQIFMNHKRMPSFSLALNEAPEAVGDPGQRDFTLDVGMWDEDEWRACRDKLGELGLSPVAEKTSNPFQMFSDYLDPDGYKVRLTYTKRPPNTGHGPDFEDN